MKKKIIIPIIACLVLAIGIIGFIIWNNQTVSTITLDINPSIEINLNRSEKVKSIVALNDDAKNVIDDSIEGKSLDKAIDIITTNTIKNGYINVDETTDIILYSNGNIDNDKIKKIVEEKYNEKQISTNVIVIEKVSEEDEKLAKKYNTSPAKIAYINSFVTNINDLSVEDLSSKSVKELKTINETGKYCDKGYTLEGDWCYKESSRIPAQEGNVCPRNSYSKDGKCYATSSGKESSVYRCNRDDAELRGDKCFFKIYGHVQYKNSVCEKGTKILCGEISDKPKEKWDMNCYVCLISYEKPTYACVTKIDGKCYWGPGKPYLDGKCMNGDIDIGGKCYEYKKYDYKCSDGLPYETNDVYCPNTIVYEQPKQTDPYCDEGFTLENDKCVKDDFTNAEREIVCDNGYTLADNGSCVDFNHEVNKTNGYICENEKYRLEGNMCVIYEVIEAKFN